jgi:ferredoxin
MENWKSVIQINVWIDEGCIACGMCNQICPEVFIIENDLAVINEDVNWTVYRHKIKDAAVCCPVEVIQYEE